MKRVFFVTFLYCITTISFSQSYLKIKIQSGNTAYGILNKYKIKNSCSKKIFQEINKLSIDLSLQADKEYQLPIKVYSYNGKSIRSTIGQENWALARKIQAYNDSLWKEGIKKSDYRKDKILWVPEYLINCNTDDEVPISQLSNTKKKIELFGEKYQEVIIKDQKLKNCVYYLVSGHGGPDPGAIGKKEGHSLCEDEYAYDVVLRLARNLISHGAKVYVITRDTSDGIRDDVYLKPDKDETCWKSQTIPLDQIKRLKQRASAVNKLYAENKIKGVKYQRMICIHVDSRNRKKKIDMFFYHATTSSKGKAFAESLRKTIKSKYEKYQRGRGYDGSVKGRDLYMLRETSPVTSYIELGNIVNERDQLRILKPSNRQAIADWLAEGLLLKK